ncbi:rhomboid family intramembrane serine protease [Nocardia callitridis]|uniref:Rhomboid family intramembrane serine protease n=1 Tax=Nocardia callitridis TaxID=648753 RepID=A0ABP9JZ75_9NOCA
MNPQPPAPTCVRHPNRQTGLACTRCGRPACPECLRPASVGQHCVDCLRQDQRDVAPVRTVAGAPTSTRPTPYVTYVLIALNVAFYAFTALQAHNPVDNQRSSLFLRLVLYPPYVADGEWWRVIGTGFLHYGPFHLLINMFALFVIGRDGELVLGRARFLAVYAVSLLGGSAAVMVFAPESPTAGASGAVYGLFGAITIILLRLRQNPTQMLILIGINVFISISLPGISLWGHLGGLAAGTLATVGILFVPAWLHAKTQENARVIGWVAVGIIAVISVAVIGSAAASLIS